MKIRSRSPLGAFATLALFGLILLLASCIDTDARISIDGKGSGSIKLGYTVAQGLLATGELEANARLIPFPVSREDFERGIAGIGGLRLVSYSRKDGKSGAAILATIKFDTLAALTSFLDPRGERAVWKNEGGRNSLRLTLAQGNPSLDPDIAALLKEAAAEASFRMAFRLPSPAISSTITGQAGTLKTSAKDTSYSAPLAQIATSASPIVWELVW
jgi:hypothetical protein